MIGTLYPVMQTLSEQSNLTPQGIDNVIAAAAEGYAFPTNLDRDPPLGGLAPKSQQDLTREALNGSWDVQRFLEALQRQAARRSS
jgi:ectoine hydroxylase-related dioxygenase (phytanoyl-CoA dioxygenase family)